MIKGSIQEEDITIINIYAPNIGALQYVRKMLSSKKKKNDIRIRMQSSKEQQEEVRKPSSVINAKKQRKTTEWERLEISQTKLEKSRGHFMQTWGSIKDKNSMDLTEAQDIKKKWQEYTEELYKKDLHDPDNHDGVITHSPRARHSGMRSQLCLTNYHY